MSAPNTEKLWPVWARVLFVVGFVGLLLLAAFAAFRGGSLNWAAARTAIIVVAVPSLALLLVTAVLTRRSSSSARRLRTRIADLAQAVSAERAVPAPDRRSTASDADLRTAADATESARRRLAATDVAGATAALEPLKAVVAGWQPSPLSDAVRSCLRTAHRLTRQLDALSRQHR